MASSGARIPDGANELKAAYESKLRDLELYERKLKAKRGESGMGNDEETQKLNMRLKQAQSEIKLMQDEFFQRDKHHQESLDKKRDECTEAVRTLERVAQTADERAAAGYQLASSGTSAKERSDLAPFVASLNATDARLRQDMKESSQSVQDLYADVFDKFKNHYEAQKRTKLASDMSEHAKFEDRLHKGFDDLLAEMQKETKDGYEGMLSKWTASMDEMRATWSNKTKAEMEHVADVLRIKAQQAESEDLDFRHKIKEKYNRLAEDHFSTLRQKIADRDMAELKAWEQKQKEMNVRSEDLVRQKMQYKAEVEEKYSQALEAAAYSEQKLREDLEQRCQTDLETRDKRIKDLQAQHLEERDRLREAFMRHEADREEELRRYEEKVMADFEKQLAEHTRRTEDLRNDQEQQDMKMWEEREDEILASRQQMERHRMKYQRETRHKFDELLRKMQEDSEKSRDRLEEQHMEDLQRKTQEIENIRQQKHQSIARLKEQLEEFATRQQETMGNLERTLAVRFETAESDQLRRQEQERKIATEEETQRWVMRMKEFHEHEAKIEVSKAEYEEKVRGEFDDMLKQKQESNLFARREMERKFKGDTATKEKVLTELETKRKMLEEQVQSAVAQGSDREDTSRAFEEEVEAKYRKQLAEHTAHTDRIVAERDALDVTRWGKREADFRTRCEAIEEARHTREMSLRAMHDRIIGQIDDEEANAIEHLEREFSLKYKEKEAEIRDLEDKRGEMERAVAELMQHELEMDAAHKRKEDELSVRFEKQLRDHMEAMSASMRSAESDLVRKWASREAELLERAHAQEKARVRVEEELRSRYDTLLIQKQDQDEAERKEMERQHSKRLSEKEDQILANIKEQQDKRREVENKIRNKYLDMVKRYQQETNMTKKSALEREMATIEKKAALERERAEMFEVAEREAESCAKDKYRKLLLALQEDWKKEASQRERRVEERLREEYEAKITMVQMRLEESNNAESPSRPPGGMAEVMKYKAEQNQRLDQFRTALRQKHDHMLSEYRRIEEAEIEVLENTVASQQDKIDCEDDLRDALERKVKMAFGKWRVDYQTHMRDKYQPLVREIKELHSKYTDVLHEREAQQAERKDLETQRERMKAMRDKMHREEEARLKQEARERREEEERRLSDGHANAQRLAEAKERIFNLWEALEADPMERHHFFKQVLGNSTTMDVVAACQAECGRLGRMLPVVQLITKVEVKSSQLDAIRKAVKEAALAGSSPAQMQQRDAEREQITSQLTKLSEELRVALDDYEAETGAPLIYHGRPYTMRASPHASRGSSRKSTTGTPSDSRGRQPQDFSPRSPAWK